MCVMVHQPLLCLTLDLAFKIFFKEKPSLLKSLLEEFLPLPKESLIEHIELMDTEENPTASDEPPGKKFVLDMKVRLRRREGEALKDPETVNVEIQTTAQKGFTNRLLAYSARIYAGQIKAGENYDKLSPVYSLVFSTVNIPEFSQLKNEWYHTCLLQRSEPPHLVLTEGIQFVLVELDKFTKEIEKIIDPRDAWCYLLKRLSDLDSQDCETLTNKGGPMPEAVQHLWKLSQDELIQERLEAEEKQRRDRVAQMDWAREEGLQEGIQKGRQEGQRKNALAMLQDGFDLHQIFKYTGLPLEEIKKLK